MRLLFAIDLQDYAGCTRTFVRHSARGVILREGKVDFSIDQDLAYQPYQSLCLLLRCIDQHKAPERDAYCPPSPVLTAELA